MPQVSRDLFNSKLESVLHYNESYPNFSESPLLSDTKATPSRSCLQRCWELTKFMKKENFLSTPSRKIWRSEFVLREQLCPTIVKGNKMKTSKQIKKYKSQGPASWQHNSCLASSSGALAAPQPLWHGGNITFKSLCTISCWWMWFTLSSIWWIQWLQDKGRDTQSYTCVYIHLAPYPRMFPQLLYLYYGELRAPGWIPRLCPPDAAAQRCHYFTLPPTQQ